MQKNIKGDDMREECRIKRKGDENERLSRECESGWKGCMQTHDRVKEKEGVEDK